MPTRAEVATSLSPQQASAQQRAPGDWKRMRGMTLIELMVVVAIVAILSTLAVGSYRRYVLRANRTDATSALLRIQVAEEKFFLQNNQYTTDLSAAGLSVATPTPNGFYDLTVAGAPAIATSFQATAAAKGTQTQDTSCQTLTIDDQGRRNSAPSTTDCWR